MTYYIVQNGEPRGPFTHAQLHSMWHAGSVTTETEFCPVGGTEWLKLKVIAAQLENSSPTPVNVRRKSARRRLMVFALAVAVVGASSFALYKLTLSAKSAQIVLPSNFQNRLTDFLREATTLSTLTDIGVTNDKYRDQFVATASAFKLVSGLWPQNHVPEIKARFDEAMRGWSLILDLWQRQVMKNEKLRTRLLANTWMNESDMKALSVPYKYEQDTTCIEILEQYAPGQIRYRDVNALVSILDTYRDRLPPVMDYRLDPNRKLIRYDENIDVLMAVAAKHFSAGRNLMESGQQEK